MNLSRASFYPEPISVDSINLWVNDRGRGQCLGESYEYHGLEFIVKKKNIQWKSNSHLEKKIPFTTATKVDEILKNKCIKDPERCT